MRANDQCVIVQLALTEALLRSLGSLDTRIEGPRHSSHCIRCGEYQRFLESVLAEHVTTATQRAAQDDPSDLRERIRMATCDAPSKKVAASNVYRMLRAFHSPRRNKLLSNTIVQPCLTLLGTQKPTVPDPIIDWFAPASRANLVFGT